MATPSSDAMPEPATDKPRRSTDPNVLLDVLAVEAAMLVTEKYNMITVPGAGGDAVIEMTPSRAAKMLEDYDIDPAIDSMSDKSFDSECSRGLEELEDFKHKWMEDERLSKIYKMKHNFSERFDNRAYLHPHGMTNFDYKAIAEERKKGLEKFKFKVRQENYKYLGQHPEIRAMISMLVKKLISSQPSDPVPYLIDFFTTRMTTNVNEFKMSLESEVQRLSKYHLNKLKAQKRIRMKTEAELRAEDDGIKEEDNEEADKLINVINSDNINYLKRLTAGPLANDFTFETRRCSVSPTDDQVKKISKDGVEEDGEDGIKPRVSGQEGQKIRGEKEVVQLFPRTKTYGDEEYGEGKDE